jgi:stage V sporulation protein D (sporulation-specific penicillin-binding protein)
MRYTQTSLRSRTRAFLIVVLCAVFALSGRLVYIQLISSAKLRFLAAEQWYRDLPLMAERGKILDCRGRVMTESYLTYSVYVRPVAVTDPNLVADVLSGELEMSRQSIYNKATSRTVSEWLVKMQVDKETAANLIARNLGGVFLSQTYNRTYPLGAVGGQVLGLVSIDGIGQEGIEAYYNQILSGVNGRIATPSDLRGVPRDTTVQYYTHSIAGNDIVLNVDSVIQNILQAALAQAYFEQGAKAVTGLVYDIETGGILASAAAPFYDLNDRPRDDVSALLGQIKNLPIVNVLEPGSTFKILTLAAALQEGAVTETDKFNCPGFRMIGGERVKCWRTRGHGTQTLAEGVQNSCNCVFMDLALRLGVDKYYEYLKNFGIGQKTGVDFYGEPSGLVLDKKWVRPVDLARIGFGQAIAVNPVQFQSIISAVIGDGTLMLPRFAGSVPAANINIGKSERRKIVSPQTAERVRNLLYGAVNNGSGRHSAISGYQIGGKTGTAQKYKDGIIDQGHYISSFTGFLSVNGKPKYSVMFLVDEPSKQGYYGSIVAAPYVGEIFRGIIDYLQIPPDPNLIKKGGEQTVTVPSVAGLDVIDASARLSALGFFVEIEAPDYETPDADFSPQTALGTFPAAGTTLKKGSPVVIRSE